jgi:hypothetical protein
VHHGINDKGGKFATGGFNTNSTSANYTCGKFAAGVKDAGGKLPSVSTTLAANLPLCYDTSGKQREQYQIADKLK